MLIADPDVEFACNNYTERMKSGELAYRKRKQSVCYKCMRKYWHKYKEKHEEMIRVNNIENNKARRKARGDT